MSDSISIIKKIVASGDPEAFVDDLIKQKGLENSDAATLANEKEKIKKQLESQFIDMLVQYVPEDKLEEFRQLLDGADAEQFAVFLKEYLPNLDTLTLHLMDQYRQQYMTS